MPPALAAQFQGAEFDVVIGEALRQRKGRRRGYAVNNPRGAERGLVCRVGDGTALSCPPNKDEQGRDFLLGRPEETIGN
jgi:hypothetical protein